VARTADPQVPIRSFGSSNSTPRLVMIDQITQAISVPRPTLQRLARPQNVGFGLTSGISMAQNFRSGRPEARTDTHGGRRSEGGRVRSGKLAVSILGTQSAVVGLHELTKSVTRRSYSSLQVAVGSVFICKRRNAGEI
jgi:hypothetical protein